MNAIRTACVAALALNSCLFGAEEPKDEDPIWKRFDDGPEGLEIAILASKTTVKVNELVRLYLLVRNAGPKEWLVQSPSNTTALHDGVRFIPGKGNLKPGSLSVTNDWRLGWRLQPGRAFVHCIPHRWEKAGIYRAQIVYGQRLLSTGRAVVLRGRTLAEIPPDRFHRTNIRALPDTVSTHPIEITVTE